MLFSSMVLCCRKLRYHVVIGGSFLTLDVLECNIVHCTSSYVTCGNPQRHHFTKKNILGICVHCSTLFASTENFCDKIFFVEASSHCAVCSFSSLLCWRCCCWQRERSELCRPTKAPCTVYWQPYIHTATAYSATSNDFQANHSNTIHFLWLTIGNNYGHQLVNRSKIICELLIINGKSI